MTDFDKAKEKFLSMFNDNENYIIFKSGKALKQHILDGDSFDFCVDDQLDPYDICYIKRSNAEDEIINKSKFSVFLRYH